MVSRGQNFLRACFCYNFFLSPRPLFPDRVHTFQSRESQRNGCSGHLLPLSDPPLSPTEMASRGSTPFSTTDSISTQAAAPRENHMTPVETDGGQVSKLPTHHPSQP